MASAIEHMEYDPAEVQELNADAEETLDVRCRKDGEGEDDDEEAGETDHFSVEFPVGPKASDASSTDDLSDEEDEDEDEELEGVLGSRGRCRACRRSRACCITLYSWLALFVAACFVAIVTVGVLVAAPYFKATHFLGTTCRPRRVSVLDDQLACSCGKRCRSSYPCLEITVDLQHVGADDHVTVLHENEATLRRQCSFYPPCKSSRPENDAAVRDYERKYGTQGQEYACLYNPRDPSEVIRTRRYQLQHVVHGLVWSSLVFILSLVILIIAIKKKGCDFL